MNAFFALTAASLLQHACGLHLKNGSFGTYMAKYIEPSKIFRGLHMNSVTSSGSPAVNSNVTNATFGTVV